MFLTESQVRDTELAVGLADGQTLNLPIPPAPGARARAGALLLVPIGLASAVSLLWGQGKFWRWWWLCGCAYILLRKDDLTNASYFPFPAISY